MPIVNKSQRQFFPVRTASVLVLTRFILVICFACITFSPALASTTNFETDDLAGRGVSMEQKFLKTGASVVSTQQGNICVVSQRIKIETSRYVAANGTAVPFDQIVRSIATSVQAVDGLDDTADGYRIQMKYSPTKAAPMILTVDGQEFGVSGDMETSSDSFWITGSAAAAMTAAFKNNGEVAIMATSQDTGHVVTDSVPTPNLAALADCSAELQVKSV